MLTNEGKAKNCVEACQASGKEFLQYEFYTLLDGKHGLENVQAIEKIREDFKNEKTYQMYRIFLIFAQVAFCLDAGYAAWAWETMGEKCRVKVSRIFNAEIKEIEKRKK